MTATQNEGQYYGAAPEMPWEHQAQHAAQAGGMGHEMPYATPQASYGGADPQPAHTPPAYAPQPQMPPAMQPQMPYTPQPTYAAPQQVQYAPPATYGVQPQAPYAAQPPYGAQNQMPLEVTLRAPSKPKFSGLAWAGLILGIIGVAGSIIPILNNVTAVAAFVGGILALIAVFGGRKIVASIGLVLCVLAIVFTVIAQQAFVAAIDDAFESAAPAMSVHA